MFSFLFWLASMLCSAPLYSMAYQVVMVDTLECEGEDKYMVMICSLMSLLAALVSVVMLLCFSSLETISVRILIFSVPIVKPPAQLNSIQPQL